MCTPAAPIPTSVVSMGKRGRSALKRGVALLCVLLVAAIAVFAFSHRQEIRDHFAAMGFEPHPRVVEVMGELDLTASGERVFLATKPTIDGSQHFNEQCAEVDHSEQGHVLGCFTGERIHLFDVTDDRVQGVVEVTAAHELLHATYSRLGEGDRAALAPRLRAVYEELSAQDPALRERMQVYEHLSDAAFANELHSVLGTEVRGLPDWLEEHYAQWFADRGSLVDIFERYHAVFVDLQQQADTLQAEMSTLRTDIEARKTAYDEDVRRFNEDAAEFSARNERYEFSSNPGEFDRIRGELADRRDALEQTLTQLQADIDYYNGLGAQLKQLGELSSELDQQLNSDLAPVTTRPSE